jgi:exopolysaccharide production protein ExoZ
MDILHLMDRPSALATSPLNFAPDQLLGNLTLTENWRHNVFGGSSPEMNVMGQMWTLCYEEQFYLFSFVSILFSRRLSRWCFVLLAAYLLIVCSTTFNPQSLPVLRDCLNAFRRSAPLVEGTVFDIHFLEFFSGVVCFWAVSTQRRSAKILSLVGILLILTCFLLGWFGTRSYQFERIAALAFAAFLILIHSVDQQVSRAMLMVPLKWFGERCYSVYLSHVIVVTVIGRIFLMAEFESPLLTLFIVVPLCLMTASLVGDLTYRYVEHPLVAYGKKAILNDRN